jgi:hypothetical protein
MFAMCRPFSWLEQMPTRLPFNQRRMSVTSRSSPADEPRRDSIGCVLDRSGNRPRSLLCPFVDLLGVKPASQTC